MEAPPGGQSGRMKPVVKEVHELSVQSAAGTRYDDASWRYND